MEAGVRRLRNLPELHVAVFAFLLHFAWEMFQVGFFQGMAQKAHAAALYECTRATFGDVTIALATYWAIAIFVRRGRSWILRPRPGEVARFAGLGMAVTIALELHATTSYWPVVPVPVSPRATNRTGSGAGWGVAVGDAPGVGVPETSAVGAGSPSAGESAHDIISATDETMSAGGPRLRIRTSPPAHRLLDRRDAVHRVRDPQPMPMDRRGVVIHLVAGMHLEAVARFHLDHRSGNLSVIGEAADLLARAGIPDMLVRDHLDLHHIGGGIQVDRAGHVTGRDGFAGIWSASRREKDGDEWNRSSAHLDLRQGRSRL